MERFDLVLDRSLHPPIVETLPNEFYKLEDDKKAIWDWIWIELDADVRDDKKPI